MTRFLINLLLLCLPALCAAADEPAIKFDKADHDFGNIAEAKGPVSCTFTYTNTGSSPLALITVNTPCDCTSADFSPRPLAPGKSAKIKVTFNPKGRSGQFKSTITVRTNIRRPDGKKQKETLTISGNVIPRK